jgi:hypothetical protein
MPATRLLQFNRKSVAPCCRPVMRPVTTKRISVCVSSLARARSSHRANTNYRKPAPAAAAASEQTKPHGTPAATPKRFCPFPPLKKRSRVAAPGRTVFNSPRAPSCPPRSAPNCKQTGNCMGRIRAYGELQSSQGGSHLTLGDRMLPVSNAKT